MKQLFLLVIIALTFSSTSIAQRFAYVDMDYILKNVPEYQTAQTKLDQVAEGWRTEIEGKMKEVDRLYKAFQAEQVLMTDKIKNQKISEIERKEREVKEFQKTKFGTDGELFKKRQELVKPIQDMIYTEIKSLAQSKSYDFIFDKSSSIAMLYAGSRYDKSDDILRGLGYK